MRNNCDQSTKSYIQGVGMWGWFVSRFLSAPAAAAKVPTPPEARARLTSRPGDAPVQAALSAQVPAPRRAAEQRRLAALQARGDDAHAYLVETALRICRMPLGAMALRDGPWLRFKAQAGVAVEALPLPGSPCELAMRCADQVTVIEDLGGDPRFSGCALLAQGLAIRTWAGAPLVGASGKVWGVLWVADRRAGPLSPVQLRTLQLLARQTALLLEAAEAPRG